uniref:Uncharacterized protein n=1 Tax=Anopheles dirus TaxID=7168 RepID=A0A182NXX8_9DIPT
MRFPALPPICTGWPFFFLCSNVFSFHVLFHKLTPRPPALPTAIAAAGMGVMNVFFFVMLVWFWFLFCYSMLPFPFVWSVVSWFCLFLPFRLHNINVSTVVVLLVSISALVARQCS